MWKRDRRNSYGWQRAFATAAAYASHNPTARQWPVRESDSRLGHCPKTKICLLAAQGGWTARSTGGTEMRPRRRRRVGRGRSPSREAVARARVEPNLTAVGVQSHRERASWRSIRPNFCAGSQSNGRLAPPTVGEGNRTTFWLRRQSVEQIEQSFGATDSRGRKSNSHLGSPTVGEGNRTAFWFRRRSAGQIEQPFGNKESKRRKRWVLN